MGIYNANFQENIGDPNIGLNEHDNRGKSNSRNDSLETTILTNDILLAGNHTLTFQNTLSSTPPFKITTLQWTNIAAWPPKCLQINHFPNDAPLQWEIVWLLWCFTTGYLQTKPKPSVSKYIIPFVPIPKTRLHSLKLTEKAPENSPGPKKEHSISNHPFSGFKNSWVSGRVNIYFK